VYLCERWSCPYAYLIKHSAMKSWGSESIAPPFFASAIDGGERSASHSCRFTTGERIPGTHWLRGWVGPMADLNTVENTSMLHCRESNPALPARTPSLYRLKYPGSPRMGDWRESILSCTCMRMVALPLVPLSRRLVGPTVDPDTWQEEGCVPPPGTWARSPSLLSSPWRLAGTSQQLRNGHRTSRLAKAVLLWDDLQHVSVLFHVSKCSSLWNGS
jgi:hypothetical protein